MTPHSPIDAVGVFRCRVCPLYHVVAIGGGWNTIAWSADRRDDADEMCVRLAMGARARVVAVTGVERATAQEVG